MQTDPPTYCCRWIAGFWSCVWSWVLKKCQGLLQQSQCLLRGNSTQLNMSLLFAGFFWEAWKHGLLQNFPECFLWSWNNDWDTSNLANGKNFAESTEAPSRKRVELLPRSINTVIGTSYRYPSETTASSWMTPNAINSASIHNMMGLHLSMGGCIKLQWMMRWFAASSIVGCTVTAR
jgi:hypothetical protein